jgi:hypothetical protein
MKIIIDEYSKIKPKVITNSVIIAIYGYTLIVPQETAQSQFFLLTCSTLVDNSFQFSVRLRLITKRYHDHFYSNKNLKHH